MAELCRWCANGKIGHTLQKCISSHKEINEQGYIKRTERAKETLLTFLTEDDYLPEWD